MKAMINGATGLVGTATVKEFLSAGYEVRASDRPGANFSELKKLGVEIMPAELDDLETLAATVRGVDAVVHVAGVFDFAATPELLERVNHQGTRNICEAVLKHNPNLSRFVQVATVGVYGKPVNCPCRESDPKNPRNEYEKSKQRGEAAAFDYHQKHGLPVTSIRPTLVYGPGARYGHSMLIALFSLLRSKGIRTLPAFRHGPSTSHVHVDDVARAALVVARSDRAIGCPFNLAAPDPVPGPVFTRTIAEGVGLKVAEVVPGFTPLMAAFKLFVKVCPGWFGRKFNQRIEQNWDKLREQRGLSPDLRLRLDQDWLGYIIGDSVYDVSALKNIGMEWKWPDFETGIKQTIEWYHDKEWIP